MHFTTKSKIAVDIHIRHQVTPSLILILQIFQVSLWIVHYPRNHIFVQLSSKLNSVCYVIRYLKSVIFTMNLRTIYFSYIYSIITYGTIFWGNSPNNYNILKLQKRAIRIIMNAGNRVPCRELFKKLNILPLYSQYILSLLLFIVKNIDEFITKSEVHTIYTRHRSDFNKFD